MVSALSGATETVTGISDTSRVASHLRCQLNDMVAIECRLALAFKESFAG